MSQSLPASLLLLALCLSWGAASASEAPDARSIRGSRLDSWNTFGPVANPPPPTAQTLPQSSESPQLLPEQKQQPSTGSPGNWWHLALVLALLVFYLGTYGVLRNRVQAESPERQRLDRFLWCWSDLYTARSCCFYNMLFSPIILLIHAVRIYLPGCLFVYARRVYWRLGGCFSAFFTDEEFPPNERSLGKVGGDSANDKSGKDKAQITWVRAMDFSRSDGAKPSHPTIFDTNMCLFQGKIEAKDILQGALGDCWLLAAMATLAEHEGSINRLFTNCEVDPRGKYHVKLFDLQEKVWKVITVDDFVPCKANSGAPDGVARGRDGMPQAMYARPNGKEIWAVILEKAMAKLCGGYDKIEAGITEWGIAAMTGGSAWRFELTASGSWERMDLVPENDPKDKRACGFRSNGEKHDNEEFFDLLRYYHRMGAVLCCGGVKPAGQDQGLIPKHAFSLLQVRTVQKLWDHDEYFRFVQVRNPWGTG
ncbi:unnamed protein product, partial [Polarella glacialis]